MRSLTLAGFCLGLASALVPQIKLSPDGPTVSRIGLGCLHLGQLTTLNPTNVLSWMENAVANGITLFDTADVYPVKGGSAGDAVKVMGQALLLKPTLRKQIQIVAKLDIGAFNPPFLNSSASYIEEQVSWFLSGLHTTYLDIVLLHYPDSLMDADAVAATFQKLHAAGKVKYFGVSNHFPHQFDLLQSRMEEVGLSLVTNEVEISVWNPSHLNYDDATVDTLYKKRIHPLAWSPLGGDPLGGLNRLFKKTGTRQEKILRALSDVGAELGGVENDVVAVAWLLRHPSGIIPLLGSTSIDRVNSQITALDVYTRMTESHWWSIGKAGGLCAFAEDQCDYEEYM